MKSEHYYRELDRQWDAKQDRIAKAKEYLKMKDEPIRTLEQLERLLFADALTPIRIKLALSIAYNLGAMDKCDKEIAGTKAQLAAMSSS